MRYTIQSSCYSHARTTWILVCLVPLIALRGIHDARIRATCAPKVSCSWATSLVICAFTLEKNRISVPTVISKLLLKAIYCVISKRDTRICWYRKFHLSVNPRASVLDCSYFPVVSWLRGREETVMHKLWRPSLFSAGFCNAAASA